MDEHKHEDEEADFGALADQIAHEMDSLSVGPDGSVRIQHGDDVACGVAAEGHIDAGWQDWRTVTVTDASISPQSADVVDVGGDEAPGDDVDEAGGVGVRRERVRVLPGWVGDRSQIGAGVTYGLSRAGFHVVRSPWYTLRGLAGCVRAVGRWVVRSEDRELYEAQRRAQTSLAARNKLRGQHARGVAFRAGVACAPAVAVWVWVTHGQWGILPTTAAAAAYVGFGVAGWRMIQSSSTPRERAVTASARGKREPISRPFVMEALDLIGLGRVSESSAPVVISASRVKGGELMRIQLAPGVTVVELVKRQEKLASALGRPTECVVIESQPEIAEGCLDLFIADRTLAQQGPPKWAWRRGGVKESFFDGVPIGVDARGREVVEPLFEANGLVGGATGFGKTNTGRVIVAGAALDPYCRVDIFDLKGGRDWQVFAPVAHTLRAGASPADLRALVDCLKDIQAEIGRRGKIMAGLSSAEVPDGKWTRKLGKQYGTRLLLIDEPQRALHHPDKRVAEEVTALLEDIERTCRASGITVKLFSQGTKEGAIPAGILGQCVRRIAHKVTNTADGNLILGGAAHGGGAPAVKLSAPGLAYVGAAGSEMVKAAVAYMDLPEVERVVKIAAAQRRKAGTLSGMAAGDVPGDEHDGGTASFLADVLAVWPVHEGDRWRNVLSVTIAERLAAAMPDEYEGMGGADVSRRMGEAGVRVGSQRTRAGEGRGVKLVDVEQAAGGDRS